MATLPLNDPARQALVEEGENALKVLDQYTAEGQQEAVADAHSEEALFSREAQQAIDGYREANRAFDARLQELRVAFTDANDRKDEGQLQRIAGEATSFIANELALTAGYVEAVQDYFDKTVSAYPETAPQRGKAAEVVRQVKEYHDAVQSQADDGEQFDAESLIADMRTSEATEQPTEAAPAPVPEKKEKAKTLQEALDILDTAEAAYKARLAEIQAEKKDVASKLVEERIAKLKAELDAKT